MQAAVPWAIPVSALDQNHATVFGVQLRRPPWMTGQEWQTFWRGVGHRERGIHVDHWIADVFGYIIRRPIGVTSNEWFEFWNGRRA